MRDQVFVSYSHRDATWLKRLQVYLAPLERRGRVRRWDDTLIGPGQRWESEILDALERARVAILLVSAEFLASDFIGNVELPRLLGAAENQGVVIIPLVLDHCNFERYPELAQFQSVHSPAAPLETLVESEQKAVLARLAAAVDDLLAKPADRTAPAVSARLVGLPARNPLFSGRADALQALQGALQRGARAALCGLPGLGKTETAIEFAYRHRDRFTWIFWCRAGSESQIIDGLCGIAAALRLPEAGGADEPATARAAREALSAAGPDASWLLILDAVEDPALVRAWLPASEHGRVLISSRASAIGGLAEPLELDQLAENDAITFLLRRARLVTDGAAPDPTHFDAARGIVRAVGGVPLALDQAGAYVEEIGCSLEEYAELWRSHSARLLAERGRGSLREDDSLWHAWSMSAQELEVASPVAADLLRLFAFFHVEALPEAALAKAAERAGHALEVVLGDGLARNAALREILRFAFLRRDAKTRRLNMHAMVQAFLRDAMPAPVRHAQIERAVAVVDAMFAEPRYANWHECEQLSAHALAVLDAASATGLRTPEMARLAAELGYYLLQRVRYADAERMITLALEIRRGRPDRGHGLARGLLIQAQLCIATARFDMALQSLAEASEILAMAPPGAEHVHVLDRIGAVELARGNLDAAARWLMRAEELVRVARVEGSVEAAQCDNDLGALHYRRGDLVAARAAFERSAAVRRAVLPPGHPGVAQSINNLAAVCSRLGEHAQARSLYLESLSLREQSLGADHPFVAESLMNLGLHELQQSNLPAARAAYERALAIQLQRRGALHPDAAAAQAGLAGVALAEGHLDEAERLFENARERRTSALGAGHPDTARSLAGLARVALARGNLDRARPMLLDALTILREKLGPAHPEVLAGEVELEQLNRGAPSAAPVA